MNEGQKKLDKPGSARMIVIYYSIKYSLDDREKTTAPTGRNLSSFKRAHRSYSLLNLVRAQFLLYHSPISLLIFSTKDTLLVNRDMA